MTAKIQPSGNKLLIHNYLLLLGVTLYGCLLLFHSETIERIWMDFCIKVDL